MSRITRFLNYGKSAGVKVLTNIMSVTDNFKLRDAGAFKKETGIMNAWLTRPEHSLGTRKMGCLLGWRRSGVFSFCTISSFCAHILLLGQS